MNYQTQPIAHINQVQLADRWNLPQRTLERRRSVGWGLVCIKLGGRVVYRLADIEAYEQKHLRQSSSTPPEQRNDVKPPPKEKKTATSNRSSSSKRK